MSNQILLIDDDIDLLETYKESMELLGYSVIATTTAQHGLELYESNRPCMVFSDIKLNGMDGYEFFAHLKELDPEAKVILVTGYEDKEKTIIAKNNGLLDVWNKPTASDAFDIAIKKNNC